MRYALDSCLKGWSPVHEPSTMNPSGNTAILLPMDASLRINTANESWPEVAEGQLSVDIFETEDAIVVQSAIAGVSAEDLDISVNSDMVTIRGQRARDARATSATMHYEECFWGAFSRTVVLPSHIRPSEAQAELKNGVLTVTLPKEHATRGVVIKVR